MAKERLLFVDDEPDILRTFKRAFGRQWDVDVAESGLAALDLMRSKPPYAVVVSDMRMPGMDGTAFLTQAMELEPDTVRILLTGQANINDAIAVINRGQIFRFLTKPCPQQDLEAVLNDAIRQNRLVRAEKELLEKTLHGSITLLSELLSLVRPEIFSRANRLRQLASAMASRLNYSDTWRFEIAALLSQIGCVPLPETLIERKFRGETLAADEFEIYKNHPNLASDLIRNIPRLEEIADAIAYQNKGYDGSGFPETDVRGEDIPLIGRLLKAIIDYDDRLMAGDKPETAIQVLQAHENRYDPEIFRHLHAESLQVDAGHTIREIGVRELRTGMMLAGDVYTRKGVLLVSRRHEVTETLLLLIRNYAKRSQLEEPLAILDATASSA